MLQAKLGSIYYVLYGIKNLLNVLAYTFLYKCLAYINLNFITLHLIFYAFEDVKHGTYKILCKTFRSNLLNKRKQSMSKKNVKFYFT